jgi:RNA polymerase sigma-70 factor (ECF subfamily)
MTFPLDILPSWFARRADESARAPARAREDVRVETAPRVVDDDDALVTSIRAGDVVAFERLFFMHIDGLVTFAAGFVGSRGAAEDIVADVFAILWERRAVWNPRHGVRAYLYAAARNRALNTTRDTESHERLDALVAVTSDVSPTIDETLVLEEQIAAVRRVLEELPEPRRRIMELRWRDGLSAEEIAVVLNVTRNAVDIQLSRALQMLRAVLPRLLK